FDGRPEVSGVFGARRVGRGGRGGGGVRVPSRGLFGEIHGRPDDGGEAGERERGQLEVLGPGFHDALRSRSTRTSTSSRFTETSGGAWMPSRTASPRINITSTTMLPAIT